MTKACIYNYKECAFFTILVLGNVMRMSKEWPLCSVRSCFTHMGESTHKATYAGLVTV